MTAEPTRTVEIDTPRGRLTVRADCRSIVFEATNKAERHRGLVEEIVLAREDSYTLLYYAYVRAFLRSNRQLTNQWLLRGDCRVKIFGISGRLSSLQVTTRTSSLQFLQATDTG